MDILRAKMHFRMERLFQSARFNYYVRRTSDLIGLFKNQEELVRVIRDGDPVVYEVYESNVPEFPGHLKYGVTILHPGMIGTEYFMTRGHSHVRRDTAEVYFGLGGHGVLVMQNEAEEYRVQPIDVGSVVYVPPGWAHRAVNTGGEDFVFLFVYPADSGHDYQSARQFVVRVIDDGGIPRVIRET